MSTTQREGFEKASEVAGTESRGSLAPLLPGGNQPSSKSSKSSNKPDLSEVPSATVDNGTRPGKRSFWKLGKKTEDDKARSKEQTPPVLQSTANHVPPVVAFRTASPLQSPDPVLASASPLRTHPYAAPSSPALAGYSSSPRLHSPASSQIFERNVQEDVLPPQASPHLPSHIITENHIPPALDASSAAITNEGLDPDSVEIVTHATHQPASVTITGAISEHPMTSSFHGTSSFHDDLGYGHRHALHDDNTSNYGTLDSADVRRLSFVSFADVVHAEHAEHADVAEDHSRRKSSHLANLTSNAMHEAPRSPSPMRSPVSSHGFGTSPPTSGSTSVKGLEASPNRGGRGPGSPLPPHSPPLGGELNVETMRQALRKTGSGDLSGARSQPMSAVGNDDGTFMDKPFK